MRYKDSLEQQSYLREACSLGNLELVFAALDALGSTPWRINREIFDVVLEVWNSGRRLGKLPPADYEEPEPEKPPNYDTDPKARIVYLTRQKQYLHAKANNHSDRCNVNYKIEIARTVCFLWLMRSAFGWMGLTSASLYSSWVTPCTCRTILTSAVVPTPFLLI